MKQRLQTFGILGAVAIFIALSSWIGLVIWGRLAGPTVDETAVVTVTAHEHGTGGRLPHFLHVVRTTNGAEYRMTFGELYPVGARLSVSYRRFVRGDTIKVIFYSRVQ